MFRKPSAFDMEPRIAVHIIAGDTQSARRLARLIAAAGHPVRVFDERAIGLTGPLTPEPHIHLIASVAVPVAVPLAETAHDDAGNLVVVLVSADVPEDAVIALLEAGADEVVRADVGPAELVARLHALARRIEARAHELRWGDVVFDPSQPEIRRGENVVTLTATEHRMLACLARRAGQVVGHRELLRTVWGPDYGSELEYVWAYVRRLRRKLGDREDAILRSVAGSGYVLRRGDGGGRENAVAQ